MKIRHKETNQILSIKYEKWIENIVNLGNVHEFEILEFPDIVQLLIVPPMGDMTNFKILDRKDAISLISKYPRQYDYAEIDIKNQILEDIAKSNTTGTKINKHKLITVTKRILYFLTFILLIPLFSRRARIAAKKFIDNNINVIQAISVVVMFIFALYTIYLMQNPK